MPIRCRRRFARHSNARHGEGCTSPECGSCQRLFPWRSAVGTRSNPRRVSRSRFRTRTRTLTPTTGLRRVVAKIPTARLRFPASMPQITRVRPAAPHSSAPSWARPCVTPRAPMSGPPRAQSTSIASPDGQPAAATAIVSPHARTRANVPPSGGATLTVRVCRFGATIPSFRAAAPAWCATPATPGTPGAEVPRVDGPPLVRL